MPSSMHRPHPTRWLLISATLCSLASSGCASRGTPGALQATIPAQLTKPCPRAEVGQLRTAGDLGSLVVRQENALNTCEQQRDLAVQIVRDMDAAMDAYVRALTPRPWWRLW